MVKCLKGKTPDRRLKTKNFKKMNEKPHSPKRKKKRKEQTILIKKYE
jgi:hypothetical protein